MPTHSPHNPPPAGMPPPVEYLGRVTALARLWGGASTPLMGTLRAELTDAELAHKLASHKIEHTRIGSGTVTLSATPTLVSAQADLGDRKSTRLNSSHLVISYAVFCLKKKKSHRRSSPLHP